MPSVVPRYPEAMFVLTGKGGMAFQRFAIWGSISDSADRSDSPEAGSTRWYLIAMSDVLVVPSLSEGFGIVILDARALGKPVVAKRVGGIPGIIEDGKTALLVPPRDLEALADAVCALWSDPARAKNMGEEGHAAVRDRFSPETMVRQTERLYLDLAAAKGLV